jgi:sec-independent protein translocase protein TatA
MFGPGFGVPELLIILAILLLIFGAGKLTDVGSSLGKGIREFRKAVREDEEPKPDATVSQSDQSTKTT